MGKVGTPPFRWVEPNKKGRFDWPLPKMAVGDKFGVKHHFKNTAQVRNSVSQSARLMGIRVSVRQMEGYTLVTRETDTRPHMNPLRKMRFVDLQSVVREVYGVDLGDTMFEVDGREKARCDVPAQVEPPIAFMKCPYGNTAGLVLELDRHGFKVFKVDHEAMDLLD